MKNINCLDLFYECVCFENHLARLEEALSLPAFILPYNFVFAFGVYFCLFFCLPCDLSFITVIITSQWGIRPYLTISWSLHATFFSGMSPPPGLFIVLYTDAIFHCPICLPASARVKYCSVWTGCKCWLDKAEASTCHFWVEKVWSLLSVCLSNPPPPNLSSVCLLCRWQSPSSFWERRHSLLLASYRAASPSWAEAPIWPAEVCVKYSVVSLLWLPSKGPLFSAPPPRPGCGTHPAKDGNSPITPLHSAAL